jgi:hypothetical protein
MTERKPGAADSAAWTGFLVATICVVGLAGLFATYAAPIPYQRALTEEAALDQLAQTPPSQWPSLRDQLGESAAILTAPGPLAPRLAAERPALRARFIKEAQAQSAQLRLLLLVVTAMAALFGAILMRLQRRAP